MLDTWNESIFSNIKNRLQDSAMKLVHAERLGEAFDSQLVIGVRESYVNLCSNPEDKLQIYRDNFEKAYLDSTERFYRTQAPSYLQQNGVQNYMKYADAKLKEEEKRALRYLETRRECNSVEAEIIMIYQLSSLNLVSRDLNLIDLITFQYAQENKFLNQFSVE
ncbi:Cullin-5 [Camelus dromedarius]|uniref:Cullin-5 n=1 Tax=Camelus dromedarius TaxID=9838 RepID=A0A5N4C6Y8_CAMDR|nr:Cullin-5 [Camelus dromedarius]